MNSVPQLIHTTTKNKDLYLIVDKWKENVLQKLGLCFNAKNVSDEMQSSNVTPKLLVNYH